MVCHRKFRTTSFQIQALGKTNDREGIFQHTFLLSLNYLHMVHHFLFASHTVSLNIDMKMILPVKVSGSHCDSPIIFLHLIEDARCRESWEDLPLELHGFSINSIQFAEVIDFWIPLNLFLPGSNKIGSRSPQAQHRVGKDRDLGIGVLISSTLQQACRCPPKIFRVNQSYTSSLCLTIGQLFHLTEKLSCRSSKRILYISQIHVMVISEMNCCFENGIYEYSRHGHSHVQILHKIVWWSSVDLLWEGRCWPKGQTPPWAKCTGDLAPATSTWKRKGWKSKFRRMK